MTKKCLVISNPTDKHVTKVADKILQLGGGVIFFYPEFCGITQHITVSNHPVARVSLSLANGTAVDLLDNDIVSVWYRRPRPVNLFSFKMNALAQEFAEDEWQNLITGMYDLLQHKFWVSSPDSIHRCARKVSQILVAEKLGFCVPQTIFTSQMLDLKLNFEKWQKQAVVKPIGRGWIIEDDVVKFVMTNKLEKQNLENDLSLQLSPTIAQEYIEKEYELRITVVGSRVFAVKIDSQKSEKSRIDWRRYDLEHTPYSEYKLPTNIEELCIKIVHYYGLHFGAIDMIRTPDGEYVFLEINGNGQFLWLEHLVNIDISGELAKILIREDIA